MGESGATPNDRLSTLEKAEYEKLGSEQREWINWAVLRDVGDLLEMKTPQLRKLFYGRPTDGQSTVDDRLLIRTYIWQTWVKVKNKLAPPVNGNLRSYWYRYLERLYRTHDLLESDLGPLFTMAMLGDVWPSIQGDERLMSMVREANGREAYIVDACSKCMDDFVWNRVLRFQDDFLFREPIDNHRKLGRGRASTLFFTEKEGLWWLCLEASRELISVMASNGEPSLLTLEYFADELRSKGISSLTVGAFCDYDPFGFDIALNVDEKLRFFGFDVTTYYLTEPSLFTPQDFDMGKRDYSNLPEGKLKTRVKRWLKMTGGVDGKPWGMHVDLVDDKRKIETVKRFIKWAEKPMGRPPWIVARKGEDDPPPWQRPKPRKPRPQPADHK